jgi:hypothetical protein
MRSRFIGRLTLLVALLALFAVTVSAKPAPHQMPKGKSGSGKKPDNNAKSKLKAFDKLTKDKVVIEGLFTFYQDTTDNSVLMAVTPEQLGEIYLCGMARATGDGTFYDTGPPGRAFPFYMKRVGGNIFMMEKNLRLRADTSTTMHNAVAAGISDHLFASSKVKSKPQDSTNAVLIDIAPLFIRDAENTNYYLGQRAKTGISFDSKHSYFDAVKSFPQNSEISVMLHFKSGRPQRGTSLQSGQSFYHTYHFSLSSIPETDYVPRLSDDRIGHFVTMYLDYSELDEESPYVRYIDRWNLKKKNPDARLSEPVEPIVYWIENTTPPEYRDAIAEGIEFWNASFEKIGFRNAVVAKQMPDDADWDPLDVRYSTIRWMVSPGVYAIGPSRANPFTGQIYDADISVSADFIRAMFNTMENFISPVSYDGRIQEEPDMLNQHLEHDGRTCTYARDLAKESAFAMSYLLSSAGSFADKDSLTKEYVHAYIVELIAHEVGHTLGFRHNFKSSTIHSLEEIQDRAFTRRNGIVGTVMEYAPPNLAPLGQQQGEFYSSVPGAYDDWMVEYSYRDFGAASPEEEKEQLEAIASLSPEANLVFATDFDLTGYSVDPLTNLFDLGNDPIAYGAHRIALTKELWNNSIKEFEKPGESYEKIRRVFNSGWRSYFEAPRYAARYIGGLYHSTDYISEDGGSLPFTPVPASEQRRAIRFLSDNIFAADAFDLPADLLNKLQSVRNVDFMGRIYGSPIEYPFNQYVLASQNVALRTLYNPRTIGRLVNNVQRYASESEAYTAYDMFTEVRSSIWSEITGPANVNALRRQLQLAHLSRITRIYLSGGASYPSDARTLAANDLDILASAAKTAAASSNIDGMTRAHFKEVVRQIEAARSAQRAYSKF